MVKYVLRLGGRRCRPRRLATSAGAFRRGLRFSGRSRRSACGTALRTRGADGSSTTVAIEGTGGSACAGADGVERPERRVRRRRRAANARRDGLARASVARTRALAPQSTRSPAMCPGLQVAEWRCGGYAATIVGGSVSERPKVQHSKCCVVHSHRGFKSRRYRHNRFMRTLVME